MVDRITCDMRRIEYRLDTIEGEIRRSRAEMSKIDRANVEYLHSLVVKQVEAALDALAQAGNQHAAQLAGATGPLAADVAEPQVQDAIATLAAVVGSLGGPAVAGDDVPPEPENAEQAADQPQPAAAPEAEGA